MCRPRSIVAARRSGDRPSRKCLANRFSVPAGNTLIGTAGRSLMSAATVPSPPTATKQRHASSRLELATTLERSAGVQATRTAILRCSRALANRATRTRPSPLPDPAFATIPTHPLENAQPSEVKGFASIWPASARSPATGLGQAMPPVYASGVPAQRSSPRVQRHRSRCSAELTQRASEARRTRRIG